MSDWKIWFKKNHKSYLDLDLGFVNSKIVNDKFGFKYQYFFSCWSYMFYLYKMYKVVVLSAISAL